MMSIVPVSATKSKMRYEFYRNTKCTDAEVKHGIDFFKQVENEDKWLGNNAQVNLNTGTYVAGPLHPYMEVAVSYFESLVRKVLKDHVENEKTVGHEIWPASRTQPGKQVEEDEVFCKSVCDSAVGANPNSVLAW